MTGSGQGWATSALFTPEHRGGSGPPLVAIHGFTDTWRTWELVLPALERQHEVLAPTLALHAGGPRLEGQLGPGSLADGVERAMDAAGFDTAHIAGNSLGGHVALQLAARGRAESVVALAPAGGWADDYEASRERMTYFRGMYEACRAAAPRADDLMATPEGRRRATSYTTVEYEHIPAELLAHQLCGVAACDVPRLIELAENGGYEPIDYERIDCPVRVVWGTEDRILRWPSMAVRHRAGLPHADWVELDGVGHCPQLDVPVVTADLILGMTAR